MVRKSIHVSFLISREASSLSPLGEMLAVGFLWIPFIRLRKFTRNICWLFCLFGFCFVLFCFGQAHSMQVSQARDQTHVTVATRAIAVTMVMSLTCWATRELLLSRFYCEISLDFVKCLFSFHWDDLLLFVLYSVNLVSYIKLFFHVNPILHSWDKSHLVMVYNPFYVLLDYIFWYFAVFLCVRA